MVSKCVTGTLLFLMLLGTAGAANAQDRSRARGFFLGVALEGVGVVVEDSDEAESGAGFGITAGYGFTRRLALYTRLGAAAVESNDLSGDYGVGHFDVGLRAHFRAPEKTVVPFLEFGLSGRALRVEDGPDTVEASGSGGAFGVGLNAHFSPAVAFTTGVTWSVGSMGNFKVNGAKVSSESFGATIARVHFGVIWFPQSK